ncbi:MAG: hypothetical protein CM1200mP10_02470 [Candidatus Neomarinimicrobiota bacterium]|nr:MAG: hypothetical protein CM1200mP10_02470 [Candidatus Neomarinimicrobiota bacterium]
MVFHHRDWDIPCTSVLMVKHYFFTDNDLGDPNLVMMDMDSGDVSILSEIFTDLWFDINTAADTLVFVKKIGYGHCNL